MGEDLRVATNFFNTFNNDIATEANIGNIYDTVLDGTWTVDTMIDMCDRVIVDLNGDETYDLKVIPQDEGPMLVSPLGGMTLLAPSYTKDISGEHGMIGTVVFNFTPPAFDSGTSDSLLVLPADLDTVEESAFEGDTVIKAVDASHCMTLGAQAFKGCAGLTKIRLSGSCLIDGHAFDGCTSLYAIYGPAGSETQAWAEAHYLLFIGE